MERRWPRTLACLGAGHPQAPGMHYPGNYSQILAEHHLSVFSLWASWLPLERWKGEVLVQAVVSGFPLHTDISVGNDRHLWLCHADPETVCWKTRKEFKSSQGTCLLSRETDSSSRGEEAVALQGQGATEDRDKGTVAPGRRQELLSGCFPKASWDVCLPGQWLACKCLAIFYNCLLSSSLEEKASCWLFFLVWCLRRRDRDISVS